MRGGLLSDYPDLTKLDRRDNLQVTVDFRARLREPARAVAATDATAVIPGLRIARPRVPMIYT